MELGLSSFAEIAPGSNNAGQRLRELLEEIEVADQHERDASGSPAP